MIRPALATASLLLAACGGENRTYPERAAYQPAEAAPLPCRPNLDGKIDAAEMKAAIGVPVTMVISPAGATRTVDLAGTLDAAQHRVWSWATDLADDQVARPAAAALAGKWFAASFPAGQFVLPVDAGGSIEGVYTQDASGIFLLGVASAQEAPPQGKTLLAYQAPIALFRFPLTVGAQWVSAAEAKNATVRGLPYAGRDTYEVKVDGSGRLELPDLTFTQVLRARTRVTLEPSVGATVTRRQVSFLFECFGEVARATSADNEPKEDFTTAAEVRRLGL